MTPGDGMGMAMGWLMAAALAAVPPVDLAESVSGGSLPSALRVIGQLKPNTPDWQQGQENLKQQRSTLALWLLAEMARQEGSAESSARWAHMALLATRMDIAMCRHPRAKEMEFHLLSAFPDTVREARVDAFRVNDALRWVRDNHQTWVVEGPGSAWVCERINLALPKPGKGGAGWGTHESPKKEAQREKAREAYFRMAFP